jgi:hypothetical protein
LRSLATSPADPRTALADFRKLCRCCFRLRALYLALGLKPIVQIVTVCPSALLVKFVGALLNLLLNRDQDGRLVRLRCECRWFGFIRGVSLRFCCSGKGGSISSSSSLISRTVSIKSLTSCSFVARVANSIHRFWVSPVMGTSRLSARPAVLKLPHPSGGSNRRFVVCASVTLISR